MNSWRFTYFIWVSLNSLLSKRSTFFKESKIMSLLQTINQGQSIKELPYRKWHGYLTVIMRHWYLLFNWNFHIITIWISISESETRKILICIRTIWTEQLKVKQWSKPILSRKLRAVSQIPYELSTIMKNSHIIQQTIINLIQRKSLLNLIS